MVPWKSLGKEPVIVLIDRVFVLAQPPPDGRSLKEEDREKLFEAKLQQIEDNKGYLPRAPDVKVDKKPVLDLQG
ncbi:unnamed protein product [Camellia sinensis]